MGAERQLGGGPRAAQGRYRAGSTFQTALGLEHDFHEIRPGTRYTIGSVVRQEILDTPGKIPPQENKDAQALFYVKMEGNMLKHAHPCESDQRAIRKYIFLCEDELQMRGHGYISDSTYEEWADGILSQFNQPMFAKVWKQVKNERESKELGAFPYVNLRDLLKSQDSRSGTSGDPLKVPASLRMVIGVEGIRWRVVRRPRREVQEQRSSQNSSGLSEQAEKSGLLH